MLVISSTSADKTAYLTVFFGEMLKPPQLHPPQASFSRFALENFRQCLNQHFIFCLSLKSTTVLS